MLTQKELKEVLQYDPLTGEFTWLYTLGNKGKAGDVAGCIDNGYILITIHRERYQAHRLAFLYMEGYMPEHGIDHKDRVRCNNRWSNLREATKQCNARNTGNPISNKSGVKGVFFHKEKSKWVASITINKKRKFLGYFVSFDEAVCHRLAAEQCISWTNCDSNSPAYQYVRVYRCPHREQYKKPTINQPIKYKESSWHVEV